MNINFGWLDKYLNKSCLMSNKPTQRKMIHEFRNTLVKFKVMPPGKPCGRFYHNLAKYWDAPKMKPRRRFKK